MGLFDTLFGSSKKKFIAGNTPPPDKIPLLTTGAALVYVNGWTPQTLKIDSRSKLPPAEVLVGFWQVESKEDALRVIDGLLSVGGFGWAGGDHLESRKQIDERLSRYTAGDKSALSADEAKMLDEVVDMMVGHKWENVKITKPMVDPVTTTLAWDVERAAFIARLAYNCGYFSEEETWNFLRKTRALAESNFPCWLEYGLSFMKGRAIVMCQSDFSAMSDIWSNILLLKSPKWGDVWAWSPLR